MNQKSFLTILPLLFLAIVSTLIAVIYFSNRSASFCSNNTFADEGLSIKFNYDCAWELKMNTRITNDFQQSTEGVLRPIISNYSLTFTKDNAEVAISKVLLSADIAPKAMDDDLYEYEIFDNSIIRYSKYDETEVHYSDYISCEDVPSVKVQNSEAKDCASPYIENFGSTFPTSISVKPGTTSLEEIDNFVLEILSVSK